ncbi:hypothetical protein PUNSTDRAFT_112429 [Punctularia strigosozonata HHB-11173 SS5]|uniref:uncharacterized protein n=1 Tax=Punctularia strigosozonata (strain HHB-11173) TaxID=741275 RepID=UPI0004418289|nr:uncharacterized protein PUNSTDRAFT_112429 [Punctularia strigosozonata HHB-11173 SS5]EIN10606.1 hypothetical protein PUNSTDRAFT_112429 [Punctularia strigosozonata HHB-11173 SS5]
MSSVTREVQKYSPFIRDRVDARSASQLAMLLSLIFHCSCFWAVLVGAAVTNRTIDDEQGDALTGLKPVYSGSFNYGPECTGCFVQPDASRAFDNSWHDTTIDPPDTTFPSVTLTFNGTAIYVFCIVPNTVMYATTMANMTFTLDGDLVGTYFHEPSTSTDFEYNVPVYTNKSMDNVQHTLKLEAQAGTNGSYLSFDYAIYTFDDTPTTTSASSVGPTPSHETSSNSPTASSGSDHKSAPIGAIVGGVVGGVALVVALLLVFFCLRRRGKHSGIDTVRPARHGEHAELDEAAIKIEPFVPEARRGDEVASVPFLGPPTVTSSDGLSSGPLSARRREFGSMASLGTSAPDSSAVPESTAGSSGYGIGTGTATTTVAAVAQPRGKGAMRRQELAQQLREMENTVAELTAQREAEIASTADARDEDDATDALRQQVETLQLEVERLRAEQDQARALDFEPPPAYVHVPDDNAAQHSNSA